MHSKPQSTSPHSIGQHSIGKVGRSRSGPAPAILVIRGIAAALVLALVVAICIDSQATTLWFLRLLAFLGRLL